MAEGPSPSQIPPGWPQCSQQPRAVLLSICQTDRPHPRWPGWAYSQAGRPPNAPPVQKAEDGATTSFFPVCKKQQFWWAGEGREGLLKRGKWPERVPKPRVAETPKSHSGHK